MQTTEEKVIEILKNVLPGYDSQESLNSQLSSLEIFGLIPKIEKAFKIGIFSIEINDENLHSTAALAKLVDTKLGRKT